MPYLNILRFIVKQCVDFKCLCVCVSTCLWHWFVSSQFYFWFLIKHTNKHFIHPFGLWSVEWSVFILWIHYFCCFFLILGRTLFTMMSERINSRRYNIKKPHFDILHWLYNFVVDTTDDDDDNNNNREKKPSGTLNISICKIMRIVWCAICCLLTFFHILHLINHLFAFWINDYSIMKTKNPKNVKEQDTEKKCT